MPTIIDIWNKALTHIGAARVSSLTEASREARVCRTLYDDIIKEVLRVHPWGFASTVIQLAVLADVDAVNFAYAYQLPADCYHPVKLIDNVANTVPVNDENNKIYEIRERTLVTDETPVYLKYTKLIVDPGKFDSIFVQAAAYRLASDLALAVPKKMALHDRMLRRYQATVLSAKNVDASQDKTKKNDGQSFINARR